MRIHHLILLAVPLLLLGGCDGDVSQAEIQRGEEAARNAPKSADDLSGDMSPEARASAERAIESSQAAQKHMDSQGDAMMRARQNGLTKN
jgi:hypothetical protein